MFFLLSKTLDLACAPLSWVAILVAVALVLIARRSPRRRTILGCLSAAVLVVLVFGNRMVANRLFFNLEDSAPRTFREGEVYDAVVLLGGVVPKGFKEPGEPYAYNDNVERLHVTYDLLRRERARRVIISGGSAVSTATSVPEAQVLADQLADWGIARDRILVEGVSLNTRQNAVETAKLARERELGTLLLVTSAFHMERALGCFRAVSLEVDVLPVDRRAREPAAMGWEVAPRSDALERATDALRELVGRAVYRTVGFSR